MSVNRGVFVYLNEQELSASLERAQKKAKKLTTQMDQIADKANPDFLQLQSELEKTNTKIGDMSKQLDGKLGPSLKQIQGLVQKAWNELANIPVGTPEWNKKMAEFKNLNTEFIKIKEQVGGVGKAFESFASKVKTVALGVIIGNTVDAALTSLGQYVSGFVSGAAKISDEIADITKTTGLAGEDLTELNKRFKDLDTRTPSEGLRQLAAEAGKLGKESVDDVVAFVEQANQIKVALGEDLGEGATTQIGKISEIFNKSLLEIGSGINEVGQKSAASEAFLTDYLFRLSGIGKQANLSAGDIIGFGAALDINGAQVEASSTAVQNFLIDFIKNADKFGKVAGFANGELQKLVDEQGVNAAFIEFLKTLKATSTTSDDFLKKLEAINIDGSRGAATFLTLANNIELVEQQQQIANQAIAEGTSITKEYEVRNNNLAGTLSKISKEWASLTSSRAVQDFLSSGASLTLNFVRALSLMPKFISDNAAALLGLSLITAAYYGNLIRTTIATQLATTAQLGRTVVVKLSTALEAAHAVTMMAVVVASDVLAGKITFLTGVQRIWNLVTAQNPLGALLVVITALGAAVKLYADNTAEAIKLEQDKNELSAMLAKTQRDLNASYEQINEQVAKFNTLSVAERENLRQTILLKLENAKADVQLAEQRKKSTVAQAAEVSVWDELVSLVTSGNNQYLAAQQLAAKTTERSITLSNEYDAKIKGINDTIKKLKEAYNEVRPAMELYNEAMSIQGVTADDLNKKISVLQTALGRAVGNQEIDLIKKALERARAQLRNLNLDLISDEKIKKEAKVKGEKYADVLLESIKEGIDAKQAVYGTMLAGINTQFDIAGLLLKGQLAQNLIDEEEYAGRIENLEITRAAAKLAAAKDQAEINKQAAKDVGDFQIAYDNKVYDARIRTNKALENATKQSVDKVKLNMQEVNNIIQASGQVLQNILGAVFDGIAQKDENNIAAFRENQQEKQTLLQRQLDAQLITQEEYNRESQKLEIESRIKERKAKQEAFLRDKSARIASAIMNTALAVTAALTSVPFNPLNAFIAGATGLAQVGIIAAQKMPSFGKGGTLPGNTYHSDSTGGLYVYDPRSKQVVATVESDEEVTNRRSSKKYRSLLKAVNADDPAAISNWFKSQPQFTMAKYQEATGRSRTTTGDVFFDSEGISSAVQQNTRDRAYATRYMVNGIVTGIANVQFSKSRKL